MFKKNYKNYFKKTKKLKRVFSDGFLLKLKFCFVYLSIVFFAVVFFISFRSLFLFFSLIPLSLICYIYLLIVFLRLIKKKDFMIKQLFFDFKLKEKNDFEKIPLPMVVCDFKGETLWSNSFFKQILKTKNISDKLNFEKILKKPLKDVFEKGPIIFEFYGLYFKIHCKFLSSSKIYLLYFENVSDFLYLKEEYKISKPCVFYIVVDNFKEVLAYKKDSEKSVLMGKIDNVVEEFVELYKGFMQKFSENQFLVVLETRYLKNITNNKFKILKVVREITGDENFSLTLSIGVGAYGKSLGECANFAAKALDLALGRGGDQAAVKTPENFEFFGGNSKGFEKNTRVRARVVAKNLLNLIKSSSNVVVMGHKFSDLDSVGSAIGICSAVKKMGKDCFFVVDLTKTLAGKLLNTIKNSELSDVLIKKEKAAEVLEFNSLLIIVDTHNPKFLESEEIYDNCKNVVVIDHHRKMVDSIKDAIIFYHEPYVSSTSELVCEIIQYFGDNFKLSPLVAQALLCGIMLDTKNFTVRVGVRTFEAAVYLRRLGADTINVKKFFATSLELYKKRTQIVVNAKTYKNCAISSTDLTTNEARIISPQAADELLKIENVKAAFVIYKLDDVVNITARSLGEFNVQVIMEYLGGGGHQLQAACQIKNFSIEESEKMLISAIDRWLF